MNSGPTIQLGGISALPDISAHPASNAGSTVEISNLDDFDLGLLGNQRKMAGTPPRSPGGVSIAPSSSSELTLANDIEFVNLEDTATKFDLKPSVNMGSSDTIRIVRDTAAPVASSREPTLQLNAGPQLSPNTYNAPAPAVAPTSTSFMATPEPVKSSWLPSFSGILGGSSSSSSSSSSSESAAPSRSWFGGGSSSSSADSILADSYLTPEQEQIKKSEGLTMLERMDRKGIGGTKMTAANTLEEINAEVSKRKDSKGLEASLRFQRSMLTTVVSGMEFLNNRYDPLGLALDGLSENINENIEDYDEIFEELYDKYKDKTKVAPEVRLIMSLGLAAGMTHVTNTMFKSRMPGMDDILRKNPDLARQMAQAAATQAVGPGFANFVSLASPSGGSRAAPPAPRPFQEAPSSRTQRYEDMYEPALGMNRGASIPNDDPRGDIPVATARRDMLGPSGVDDILRTLNAVGDGSERLVPHPAMDMEETGSVGSGMTTETMRRNGMSRRRKTSTQPTGATLTLNV